MKNRFHRHTFRFRISEELDLKGNMVHEVEFDTSDAELSVTRYSYSPEGIREREERFFTRPEGTLTVLIESRMGTSFAVATGKQPDLPEGVTVH